MLDVRSRRDIDAAGELAASHCGGLDLLINDAGITHESARHSEVDDQRVLDLLSVNRVGPLLVSKRFLPLLRPGGLLVDITMPARLFGTLTRTENYAFIASWYALTWMIAAVLTGTGQVAATQWFGRLRTDFNNCAEKAIPRVVSRIEQLSLADHGACMLPDPW